MRTYQIYPAQVLTFEDYRKYGYVDKAFRSAEIWWMESLERGDKRRFPVIRRNSQDQQFVIVGINGDNLTNECTIVHSPGFCIQ